MTAFGKNPALLGNIPSFRQLSGQYNKGRTFRKGKGIPYFIGQYRPPQVDSDTVALIAGNYEHLEVDDSGEKPVAIPVVFPFVKFVEHFDGKTEKSAICSAGPFRNFKDMRNPCNGCDIYWATLEPDDAGKKRSTRMSRQSKFAVGIIDYSPYHKQAQHDMQTGRPRINPKTKEPYFNWVKCEGRGCEMCAAKLPTKFGHNPHWPMSWGYYQTLLEQDREVGKSCRSCGGIETIASIAWICRGCGEAAIDMSSTTLKMEDIIKISESHFTCKCGKTDFLQELVECRSCSKGDRMTLFDVECKVRRIPTGQNNQSVLSISNWVLRRKLPQGSDLAVPKDLLRIFAPTPNKDQLDRFGSPPLSAPQDVQDQPPDDPPPGEGDEARAYGETYR